jgi:hypothetical protein
MKTTSNILTNPTVLLRIGGGICFLGHGVLALGAKTGFVGLLGSFGLGTEEAVLLLKLIGCIDILVGLSILFKPNKRVLQWAAIWTGLTILAWGIQGDSLMDLARRAPYVTTPLALLFLLYQRKGSQQHNETGNSGPQLMDTPAIQLTVHTLSEEQNATLNALDLSLIAMKLMDPQEGEGWNSRQCAEVSEEYRRFLAMHLLFPNEEIVPNLAIDTMWHYHILDTAAYQRDCLAIFGEMLHHYPYFGMHGSEDEVQFVSAFDRTRMLYETTFGKSMDGPEYLPSFRARKSA